MDNIFYNNLILVPGITFLFTVFLKWLIIYIKSKKINISEALWSGWMPSIHSAVVVSIATSVAIKHWLSSDYFAISMAFTAIIIYDAINVRYEAWLHAEEINKIIWKEKFKESLGHLPSEAFAWSVLGILIAVVLFYV